MGVVNGLDGLAESAQFGDLGSLGQSRGVEGEPQRFAHVPAIVDAGRQDRHDARLRARQRSIKTDDLAQHGSARLVRVGFHAPAHGVGDELAVHEHRPIGEQLPGAQRPHAAILQGLRHDGGACRGASLNGMGRSAARARSML